MRDVFYFIADYLGVPRPRSIASRPLYHAAELLPWLPSRLRVGRLKYLTPSRIALYSHGCDLSGVLDHVRLKSIQLTDYRTGLAAMLDDFRGKASDRLRVTPSTAPIQRCIDRGLPFAFPGGITVAHAADVAVGHVQAMEHGVPGERYILGGERLTIPNYFALVSQICRRRPPRLVLPQWAMLGVGAGCTIVRSLGIGSVPLSFRQIRNIVGRYAWYSSEKARSVLGYESRPASEAIKAYADWVAAGRPAGGAG